MNALLTMGEPLGVLATNAVGRVVSGTQLTLGVAGSEINVAIGAARLGVPTWFAGAVGDDPIGRTVQRTLRQEGVAIDLLDVDTGPTGLLMKEKYGIRSEPRVYYYRKQTAMCSWAPVLPWPAALDGGWVHVSGITLMIDAGLQERVRQWLASWVSAFPGRLSIDLNVRHRLGSANQWQVAVKPVVNMASLVFASRSELIDLWGTDKTQSLIAHGIFSADQVVVVTDGPNGAWAECGGTRIASVPSRPVPQVVDVVGAGDGFSAGVLAGRLRNWNWVQCLHLGAVVGAFAVAHAGDWEGYPLWDEAMEELENRWVER